jgi:hypothetical protein
VPKAVEELRAHLKSQSSICELGFHYFAVEENINRL